VAIDDPLGSSSLFADASAAVATQAKGTALSEKSHPDQRLAASLLDAGGAEENDDDGGYAKVALAALRAPVAEDPSLGSEGAKLRDRALRSVLAQRVREAKTEHKAMKEFMKSFARNLKLSVLEDSKGDMPEDERLAAIKALRNGQEAKVSLTGEEQSALVTRHAQKHGHLHHHHHNHATSHHKVRMLNGVPPSGTSIQEEGSDEAVDADNEEQTEVDDGEGHAQSPMMLSDSVKASRREDLEEEDSKPSTRGLARHWNRNGATSIVTLSWVPVLVAAAGAALVFA